MAYNPVTRKANYEANKERDLATGKAWRDNNKERHSALSMERYYITKEQNPILYMWKHAKARAVKKNLEFTITIEDILVPTHCPYLGNELVWRHPRYCPSLDRIDSTKGYTKENIQVTSKLFNVMKWDSTQEELLHFCKSVLERQGRSQC